MVWHSCDGQTEVGALVARVLDVLGIELTEDGVWVLLDVLADAELLVERVSPPGGMLELGLDDEAALEASAEELVVWQLGMALASECVQDEGTLGSLRSEEETAKEVLKVQRQEETAASAELQAKEADAKTAESAQEVDSKELSGKEAEAKTEASSGEEASKELTGKEADAKADASTEEAESKELSGKEVDSKAEAATQEEASKELTDKESAAKEQISKEEASK